MQLFNRVIQWIQAIPPAEFLRYIYISIGASAVLAGGIIFIIYSSSDALLNDLKKLEKLTHNAVPLLKEYESLHQAQNEKKVMLQKYRDADLKVFFELFCKKVGMTPEAGWDSLMLENLNDQFEELSMNVTFKRQSTQKIVDMFGALEKEARDQNRVLYSKSLSIKRDTQPGFITCALTLATIRMKEVG